MHAKHEGTFNDDKSIIKIKTFYDNHYCQHFKTHSSSWTFELSDWLVKSVENRVLIKIDDKDQLILYHLEKPFIITIPEGVGNHFIEISL